MSNISTYNCPELCYLGAYEDNLRDNQGFIDPGFNSHEKSCRKSPRYRRCKSFGEFMKHLKEKPVQYFTKEYLERCKGMTPSDIIDFLENYRTLVTSKNEKCQLISFKIEPSLLNAFKVKAKLQGISYQTLIKSLMKDYLTKSSA